MLRPASIFNLLLACLLLRIALCPVHADEPFGAGHIGCKPVRDKDSDFFTVEYVAAHGPADEAGIKKGDLIVAINAISTRGMSTQAAAHSLIGDIGGVVKLTIRRAGSADQEVSITWRSLPDAYSQAAAEGDPMAEYYLGHFYYSDPFATRDQAMAAEWFRKAADQGYAPAQVDLGYLCENGLGVAKDQPAAAAWYLKAATQGNATGERNLAILYYRGIGVPQSNQTAFAWFYSAAQEDDSTAEEYLGYFYRKGLGVIKNNQAAYAWYYRSAQQNNPYGEWGLGFMYEQGLGVKRDIGEAINWCATAQAGLPKDENLMEDLGRAERYLAIQYYRGEGMQRNDKAAYAWFYSAAQMDDPFAEEYLGHFYLKGLGVTKSDQAAYAWYYRSAQQNNPYGEWGLAYMYEEGRGVTRNAGEALKWYQKAQSGLPQDERLNNAVAGATLTAFLKSPDVATIKISFLSSSYFRKLEFYLKILAAIYIPVFILLLIFTLKASGAPSRLPVAIGWVLFNPLSQLTGLYTILVTVKLLTAGIFFATISFFTALPVLVSTCGSNRNRIWKTSSVSWKKFLLYAVLAALANHFFAAAYHWVYAVVMHKRLALSSTWYLIQKMKHASVWFAYAAVAMIFPMAEEITFRGYLFDALRKRFSGKFVIITTAALFALMHFQLNHFVPLFGAGLLLGLARFKTDSLHLPMFLHAINNALVLAFMP